MTDNPTDTNDGEGRYASRTRVNRRVILFDNLASVGSATKTLHLNGKIARVVIDPSRVKSTSTTATSGSFKISMDVEDAGGTEYPYCDTIANLDYRTSSNTPLNFQTSEGGNLNADGGATSGLHFTVSAPSSSTTGGVTIDEAAPWNGLVCGDVTFTIADSAGTFDADTGVLRLILIME
jgi:hypothetical protein